MIIYMSSQILFEFLSSVLKNRYIETCFNCFPLLDYVHKKDIYAKIETTKHIVIKNMCKLKLFGDSVPLIGFPFYKKGDIKI